MPQQQQNDDEKQCSHRPDTGRLVLQIGAGKNSTIVHDVSEDVWMAVTTTSSKFVNQSMIYEKRKRLHLLVGGLMGA